jgi:hypothetical protein
MSEQKTWVVELEEDPSTGDLVMPLPPEAMKQAGIEIGDTLDWIDNKDGSYTLKKKEREMEWVLVEAISTFRMRYVIEVPKGKKEWALDTVTMNEAQEFSQEHLTETIVSSHVITEEKIFDMCCEDNPYLKSWSNEMKIEKLTNKIDINGNVVRGNIDIDEDLNALLSRKSGV